MNDHVVRQLRKYFAQSPALCGKPASEAAITSAQERLGCIFEPAYVEFLRLFGCGVVGPDPIFGLGADAVDAMGSDEDVVTQTEHFRAQQWLGVSGWYVVSVDGRGNPIGIDSDGRVRLSDHDAGEIVDVAESFEKFLVKDLSR